MRISGTCDCALQTLPFCKFERHGYLSGLQKKKYKSSRYETCFDCLPEEKKKDILAKQKEKKSHLEN